jgi:hypothetical protein
MSNKGKKNLRLLAMGVSMANGYWASLTQAGSGLRGATPVLLAMASVWAGYLSLAWLIQGMRSR